MVDIKSPIAEIRRGKKKEERKKKKKPQDENIYGPINYCFSQKTSPCSV